MKTEGCNFVMFIHSLFHGLKRESSVRYERFDAVAMAVATAKSFGDRVAGSQQAQATATRR